MLEKATHLCTPAPVAPESFLLRTHHPRDHIATRNMAEKFAGTWKLAESENFDDYLKAMGVGFAARQVVSRAKPTIVISVGAGGAMTIKTPRNEVTFKLGEEFEETTPNDKKTKNVISLDNGKLLQKQKWDDKEACIEREVVGHKLITKLKTGGVEAVRTFVKEA
ncbi:fatty acid-binding protein, heart-like [Engraulis encrasicolus]|uniref:fatty acid-binding protein, heart-like n=1 Tax=Engraulis encrasicolus TaxID=184585 RepID=UPI002FD4368D